jgi:hypothetical protein
MHCKGGAQFGVAFNASLLICVALYVIVLVALFCLKRKHGATVAKRGSKFMGQLKLTLNFVQIISAMATVMPAVPWTSTFRNMSLGLGFVNLDFLGVLTGPDTCALAVPAMKKFTLHMILPLMFLGTIIFAFATSVGIDRIRIRTSGSAEELADLRKHARLARWATTMKAIVLLVLFMYPGICTRIFNVLRCDAIEGEYYPALDYSIVCWQGAHMDTVVAAVICLVAYVVGVPASIFWVLYKNRRALHDESHPKYKEMKFELGGLYVNCEFV